MSVFGIGSPIVPVYSRFMIGLQVATGDVSDSPYPSMIGTPVIASHFSATARCTAMPPPFAMRRLEKSSLRNSAFSASAL